MLLFHCKVNCLTIRQYRSVLYAECYFNLFCFDFFFKHIQYNSFKQFNYNKFKMLLRLSVVIVSVLLLIAIHCLKPSIQHR